MKMFREMLLLGTLLFPIATLAFDLPSGLPFGGYVVSAAIPCGCPPFGMVINYKPFFTNSITPPIFGSLYYAPGQAMLFAYFGFVAPGTPSTWNLGAYTPDGGQCQQPDPATAAEGDPCEPGIPVPALGTIRYMGTSLPSFHVLPI
ncbi:hypothetical protein KW785_02790 [Candidatus Parcubacteria bacterium]|nr:hypothetical protein [Candidatus Parcubacteria bacterium]